MRTQMITIAAAASTLLAGAAMQPGTHQPEMEHAGPFEGVTSLVAVVYPTEGNECHGVVRFDEYNGAVRITADIRGLTPNQQHGFHIHEYGDATKPDGTSAGGHYNPEGHDHALPPEGERHAGDLGNLEADANGRARLQMVTHSISLVGEENPILGRGVIVHEDPDDGGQPTGNAGARIGIGVIGIANTGG